MGSNPTAPTIFFVKLVGSLLPRAAAGLTCLLFPASVAPGIMRKCAQVFYSGRVQGVGFRYTVRDVACGFEVTGYVRNLPDGRVEMVAEGEEAEVQSFLDGIQASQLGSCIRGADLSWQPPTKEFTDFEIRY